SRSHWCSNSANRLSVGNRPKFIEPMLSEASSGANVIAGCMRSSTLMCGDPPLVRLMTASDDALIFSIIGAKSSGSCDGRPSPGLRAWRWTIEAPACAAWIEASEISSDVAGRWGDMLGVWIDPVTAQVMMILRLDAMVRSSLLSPANGPRADVRFGYRLSRAVSRASG